MNRNIWITIKKELRGILRDKKSLLMMLVAPIMIPIFIFLFSNVYDQMLEETPEKTYEIGVNYQLNDLEKSLAKEFKIKPKFYSSEKTLANLYEDKKLNAYIIKEDEKYIVYSNTKDSAGIETSAIINTYLEEYNKALEKNYLISQNINLEEVAQKIKVENKDLPGKSEMVNMIIFLGIVFAMMSISLTAIYGVTDTTAGEKERGTLETFLTFPIKTKELIIGKYLAISISCLITSLISTILVLLSIKIASGMFEIYKGASMNINALSIITTLLIMFSYSFFVSGLCISIASFTKTYKEAQSALTPVSLITMIPMFFNILEIKLSTSISFIPVVSHTMLINDSLSIGLTNNCISYLIIILLSTIIYSIILIKLITKLYKSEKILFSI